MASDGDGPMASYGNRIDLDDEVSGLATEREAIWMWLGDLEDRVAELEELCGIIPPLCGQRDMETRVGDLEALTEMLLPAVYARYHRPLGGR
jgi:hypothetical protein